MAPDDAPPARLRAACWRCCRTPAKKTLKTQKPKGPFETSHPAMGVRLPAEKKAQIQVRAATLGLSTSDYLRRLVEDADAAATQAYAQGLMTSARTADAEYVRGLSEGAQRPVAHWWLACPGCGGAVYYDLRNPWVMQAFLSGSRACYHPPGGNVVGEWDVGWGPR